MDKKTQPSSTLMPQPLTVSRKKKRDSTRKYWKIEKTKAYRMTKSGMVTVNGYTWLRKRGNRLEMTTHMRSTDKLCSNLQWWGLDQKSVIMLSRKEKLLVSSYWVLYSKSTIAWPGMAVFLKLLHTPRIWWRSLKFSSTIKLQTLLMIWNGWPRTPLLFWEEVTS